MSNGREGLKQEAAAAVDVAIRPVGPRVAVFPVQIKEKDRRVIDPGLKKELPHMGVILGVGYGVNHELLESLDELERREGEAEGSELEIIQMQMDAIQQDVLQIGQVVLHNRFSGMATDASDLLMVHRDDIFGVLEGDVELELKRPGSRDDPLYRKAMDEQEGAERARQVRAAAAADEGVVTPG